MAKNCARGEHRIVQRNKSKNKDAPVSTINVNSDREEGEERKTVVKKSFCLF